MREIKNFSSLALNFSFKSVSNNLLSSNFHFMHITLIHSLVLRIRHSSDKAKYKLGKKFGAIPGGETTQLLKLAKTLNLNVIGVSFHIGSSCEDYKTYCEAIEISRNLFEHAAGIGYKFSILDIGGKRSWMERDIELTTILCLRRWGVILKHL